MRGRPPRTEWTDGQLKAWREALRAWMMERGYGPRELEDLLGYNSGGYLVRMYLGELETSRPPSARFVRRLEEVGFSPNGDGRQETFPADLRPVVAPGVVAVADLPPGTVILGEPRQCPECAAEAEEGKRHPSRTWYVFPHPRQKYCSPEHRRAWRRRQRRRRQAEEGTAE